MGRSFPPPPPFPKQKKKKQKKRKMATPFPIIYVGTNGDVSPPTLVSMYGRLAFVLDGRMSYRVVFLSPASASAATVVAGKNRHSKFPTPRRRLLDGFFLTYGG